MGQECADSLVSVLCLDEHGELVEKEFEEMESEYRSIPELKTNFVLRAVFRGKRDNPDDILARMEKSREKRKTTQPITPSAGCVFKNPPEIPAGKLIEELNLKGASIGDAEISAIHGNFIVNKGHATAFDYLDLVDLVKAKALKERNIVLDMEAQVIGDRDCTF